eukprot:scaffold869_cov105-Isochrysis_galbana.AAC.47
MCTTCPLPLPPPGIANNCSNPSLSPEPNTRGLDTTSDPRETSTVPCIASPLFSSSEPLFAMPFLPAYRLCARMSNWISPYYDINV